MWSADLVKMKQGSGGKKVILSVEILCNKWKYRIQNFTQVKLQK